MMPTALGIRCGRFRKRLTNFSRTRVASTGLMPTVIRIEAPQHDAGSGVTVLYYGGAVLFVAAWLAGGAAVWLLWRPASTAFFKPPGSAQALHQAHMAELDRLRSSRARSPRQV
jgi:hypothetical protein